MSAIAGPVVTVKDSLHLTEQIMADNQRMGALVAFPIPLKEAGIKRILEQLVKIALTGRLCRFRRE